MALESNQISTTYNLIISRVDEHNLISIIQHFSEVFSLEKEIAEQILKSAPIVFLQGVDKNSLKILKGRLIFLSKMGVEFMISTRLSSKIPRVVWSGKSPNYTESSSSELIKYVNFQWDGNAFVCPNCSETFVFKRIGNPLATSVKVDNDVSKYIDTDSEGHQVNKPAGNIPEKTYEKAFDVADSDVIELPPLQPDGGSEEIVEPQQLEESSEGESVSPEVSGNPVKPKTSQEETFLVDDENVQRDVEMAKQPVITQNDIKAISSGKSANCSVFVTSVPPDKKVKTAELIAKIKGVPVKQAEVLTTHLLVPILKDVTKSEATKCLEEFQKIGIKGRITVKI